VSCFISCCSADWPDIRTLTTRSARRHSSARNGPSRPSFVPLLKDKRTSTRMSCSDPLSRCQWRSCSRSDRVNSDRERARPTGRALIDSHGRRRLSTPSGWVSSLWVSSCSVSRGRQDHDLWQTSRMNSARDSDFFFLVIRCMLRNDGSFRKSVERKQAGTKRPCWASC
jgi:hypothetical protein